MAVRKTQDRLTFEQRLTLLQMLNQVCRRNEEGVATYDKGWDDERVAIAAFKQGGKVYTVKHAADLRRRTFPPLNVVKPPSLAEIHKRLTRVEDYLNGKDPKFGKIPTLL